MELFEFLTQLAPILSFITVIIAIIFGVIQLKQFKTQRKDIAAVEIMRTMQDTQFTDSLHLINQSEQLDSVKEVHDQNPNLEKAIFAITTKFETLGFLVYKRVIPIDFVEQLVGGVCLALWQKLNLFVLDYRKVNDQKLFLEWFEWLSYILKKRERDKAKPALEKFKNWNS